MTIVYENKIFDGLKKQLQNMYYDYSNTLANLDMGANFTEKSLYLRGKIDAIEEIVIAINNEKKKEDLKKSNK